MYELLGDPVNNEINTENHIFIALSDIVTNFKTKMW